MTCVGIGGRVGRRRRGAEDGSREWWERRKRIVVKAVRRRSARRSAVDSVRERHGGGWLVTMNSVVVGDGERRWSVGGWENIFF